MEAEHEVGAAGMEGTLEWPERSMVGRTRVEMVAVAGSVHFTWPSPSPHQHDLSNLLKPS